MLQQHRGTELASGLRCGGQRRRLRDEYASQCALEWDSVCNGDTAQRADQWRQIVDVCGSDERFCSRFPLYRDRWLLQKNKFGGRYLELQPELQFSLRGEVAFTYANIFERDAPPCRYKKLVLCLNTTRDRGALHFLFELQRLFSARVGAEVALVMPRCSKTDKVLWKRANGIVDLRVRVPNSLSIRDGHDGEILVNNESLQRFQLCECLLSVNRFHFEPGCHDSETVAEPSLRRRRHCPAPATI